MVDDAVQSRHRGQWVLEDALPVREDEVGRNSHRSTFVAFGTSLFIMHPFLAMSANSPAKAIRSFMLHCTSWLLSGRMLGTKAPFPAVAGVPPVGQIVASTDILPDLLS